MEVGFKKYQSLLDWHLFQAFLKGISVSRAKDSGVETTVETCSTKRANVVYIRETPTGKGCDFSAPLLPVRAVKE